MTRTPRATRVGAGVVASYLSLIVTGSLAVAQPVPPVKPNLPAQLPKLNVQPFLLEGPLSVPESYPYGPGDRTTTIKVNMLAGENAGNVEYWVLYSDDKPLLTGAHVGSDFPHGKATLKTQTDGSVLATFIFPHTDNSKPNASYVRQRSFASGKKLFYKWVKKKGTQATESQIVEFTMPDKLTIANFGDSYAAGEGAPHSSPPLWDNELAHRSGNSGQALAVKQFKLDHPGTAVAFKNVACSGAGVNEGIIQSQKKKGMFQAELHSTPVPPQIDQVRDWLSANHYETLNIALLSIGINEIGFDNLVTNYYILPGNITNDEAAHVNIDTDIEELAQDYTAVKNAFDASFDYDHVLVSEYPDLTHWKNDQLCGRLQDVPGYGLCWGAIEILSGEAEYGFAASRGAKMNATIKSIVKTFSKWDYTGAAMEDSKLHGLARCDDPWFNTIGASLLTQGDVNGTWHPNRAGHREFCKPIVLRNLDLTYLKLAKQYARERQAQIASDKAGILSRLAQKRPLVLSPHRPRSLAAASAKIPADILKKAQDDAKKLRKIGGEDNRMGDDNEP